MSDNLFPNKQKKEYKYKEKDRGMLGKIKKKLESLKSFLKNINDLEEEESEPKNNKEKLKLTDPNSEDEKNFYDKLDRFTIIVVSIEVLLIIYVISAFIGLVPFF